MLPVRILFEKVLNLLKRNDSLLFSWMGSLNWALDFDAVNEFGLVLGLSAGACFDNRACLLLDILACGHCCLGCLVATVPEVVTDKVGADDNC